ncbi:hypothetical protein N9W89_07720 [Hellea sp.]|nr:hypothetical protein [Hellea sp.]
MSEDTHIFEPAFAPELSIGTINFANYDPHLAKRSVNVLREELARTLGPSAALKRLQTQSSAAVVSLHLSDRDFSSPERLGKALARSILRQIGL